MAGNLLIAQSGGPTAVINATLSGILEEGLLSGEIDRIYGSRYGIQGLLEEKLLESANPGAFAEGFPREKQGGRALPLPSTAFQNAGRGAWLLPL